MLLHATTRDERVEPSELKKRRPGTATFLDANGQPSTGGIRAMLEARDYSKQVQGRVNAEKEHRIMSKAAVKMQAWFRMMKCAKLGDTAFVHIKNTRERKAAATTLQRIYRGHLGRHDPDLALRIEFRRLEHSAAILIQAVTRGHQDRVLLRETIHNTESAKMDRAVTILQRHARGFKARKLNKNALSVLREKVRIIERFHRRYFQPWNRVQKQILQTNLDKIVVVQSRIRRFLSVSHTRELVRIKAKNQVAGMWQILYLVMMTLLMVATVNQKSNGDILRFHHAARSLLGLSVEGNNPGGPYWDTQVGSGTADDRQVTFSSISRPGLLFQWMDLVLLPRYREVGTVEACSDLVTNNRQCNITDGLAAKIVNRMIVQQSRAPAKRVKAPYALSREMPTQACFPDDIGGGGICRQIPIDAQPLNLSAAPTVVRGNSSFLLGSASGFGVKTTYGSALFSFSYESSVDIESSEGYFASYGSTGHMLGSNGVPLILENAAATDCGVPCQEGLQKFALAEWLDQRTRGVTISVALASERVNALLLIKGVIEFSAGGAIRASAATAASPLLVYPNFGVSPWYGQSWQAGARLAPEIIFLLFGLAYLVALVAMALNNIRVIAPKGGGLGYTIQMKPKQGSIKHRLRHLRDGWNYLDFAIAFLVIMVFVVRLGIQSSAQGFINSNLIGGHESWRELRVLSNAHFVADILVVMIIALMWARTFFMYIPMVWIMRQSVTIFIRLLAPFFMTGLVVFVVAMGLIHCSLLLHGSADPRFSSSSNAMRTLSKIMLEMNSPTFGVEGAEFGRRRYSTMKGASYGTYRGIAAEQEPQPLFVGVFQFFGMLIAGLISAIVMHKWSEETELGRDSGKHPWLYSQEKRMHNYYNAWHCPPLVEVFQGFKKLIRSHQKELDGRKQALLQFRVLERIRHTDVIKKKKTKFKWIVHFDENESAKVNKWAKTDLRKVSRRLAHVGRSLAAKVNGVAQKFEEAGERLLLYTSHVFRKSKYINSTMPWPNAVLDAKYVRKANKTVAEEEEIRKKKVIKIPRKRLDNLSKQLRSTETMLEDLLLELQAMEAKAKPLILS